MKKLREKGRLERHPCENPEELEGQMETFISLHQESWVERGKPGALVADHRLAHRVVGLEDVLRDAQPLDLRPAQQRQVGGPDIPGANADDVGDIRPGLKAGHVPSWL